MSDYSPIYDVVRNKLKKREDDLPNTDPDLVEETVIVVSLLLDKAPCLKGSYDGVTGDKKVLFDGAAGRVVAARLRPSLLANENDGAGLVVETQIGDSRKRYAAYNATRAPGMVGAKSLEEQWVDQALENLALLCPKKPLAGKGSFVGLPGRRRAEEARTGYTAVDARDLLLPRSATSSRSGRGDYSL